MNNQDIVRKNGIFFRLGEDKQTNFDKTSLKMILPEDVVEYSRGNTEEEYVRVVRIVSRREQYTLGVIYAKSISLPMLNIHFLKFVDIEYLVSPTFCLVRLSRDGSLNIVRKYGKLSDRSMDYAMFSDWFMTSRTSEPYLQTTFERKEPIYKYDQSAPCRRNMADGTFYTFNIDPEHSKDFDDAISVDIENNIIYVHIVDIHHLVSDKEELRMEAFSRCFTLYLYEKTVNAFPESYSENLFSLLEGQERWTITVEMRLDEDYQVMEYFIYPSIIKINKRYNYQTALEAIDYGTDIHLSYLTRLIGKQGWKHSVNALSHKKLWLDPATGSVLRVTSETPNVANMIVEALMVKTNTLVSLHLESNGIFLERHHEKNNTLIPTEKISEVEFLDVIRKLRRASYSESESGHYALDLNRYTHFTSPIRRAFDILIHDAMAGYIVQNPKMLIDYINHRGELTDMIENLYRQLKILSIFEGNVSQSYPATVLGVSKHGVKCFIDDLHYSVFIHVSNIRPSIYYWKYHENELHGGESKVIHVGDEVSLKVLSVNWLERKPSFLLFID